MFSIIRKIAFEALLDIYENKLYSNLAINKYIKENSIKESIDRGFFTQLVYGVVEKDRYLDFVIERFSKVKKISKKVRIILKIGIYQILFMDGVKDFAAVNETVKLSKIYVKSSAGFINAILRNTIRNKNNLEVNKDDIVKYLSIKYSYEENLIRLFLEMFEQDFLQDMLESFDEKPKLYGRVNLNKIKREELLKKLEDTNIKATKVNLIEEAILIENIKDIENNELFKKGYFTIQDISSMMVCKVPTIKDGMKILDICAAPGGKTTHIAERLNGNGKIISKDIFDHKLKLIKNSIDRLDLKNIELKNEDALVFNEDEVNKYDLVLCDVPCSGFGIVRRKPEIKYKNIDEIEKLPHIQYKILLNASKYIKDDGEIIYSTCTINKKENIEVVNRFLEKNTDFKLEKITNINLDLEQQEKGYIEIYPNIHMMDGFFIAKLRKVQNEN